MIISLQHYRRVHAERNYVCTKCASSFCQDYDLQKHWAKCGVMYQCGSCSVDYTTKEALLMHCKTEKHVYPAEYQRQKKVEANIKKPKNQPQESSPAVITITQTPIIVIPSNALQTSFEQNNSRNILEVDHSSSSKMTIPENSHTNILSDRNDALVQTDIYGVETLNLSSTNDHSNSDNFNACNSPHVSNPQQYSVIDRPVKSPGRRQGQIKRRSVGGRDMNPGSPRRKKLKSTTGMQTSVSLTRKKAAAVVISTQTPGDFILQTAMKQADIKIQKRTIGSQVTPKKANSQGQSQLKSSEIQTFISGFRPQLVDSSSQVQQKNILSEVMAQNMSEQETMTELPLTAATQTPQSYLGGESANYNVGGGGAYHSSVTVDGHSNEPFSYNGKCPVSTTDSSVQIFSENFETSVKYQMPSSLRQETSDSQLFKGTASNLGGSEHTISNFSADNKLPTDLKTSDHEVQAMSASEFETLLQSSGIFINNSDLFKQTSFSTVQPHTNFINSSRLDSQAANLDFLNIGTSMTDMNTQTGSDYNLFDELEAVDSNTQTPGDMDFIDLVMSNMETQTLNDDDLRSLGLIDTYTIPSTHTHSMAIGTSDFESNFSSFDSNPFIEHHANNTDTCTMGVGTSDFDKMEDAIADVGKKKAQNMYYAYKLS
ncbi:ATMIN-like protein, partial [Mya arenaria]